MVNLDNLTPRAEQVLALARKEAKRLQHNFVGTEHLLLGLTLLGEGVGFEVLRKFGLDFETVRLEVEKQVGNRPDEKCSGPIPYTPRVEKVLAIAAKEARAINTYYVGTEHILMALLREGEGVAAQVLKSLGVDHELTRQEILKTLDPLFLPAAEETSIADALTNPDSRKPKPDLVDTGKRYDVYCTERGRQVVYQDVRFKGAKKLFPEDQPAAWSEFIELEQADGQRVFVARASVIKFHEHCVTPRPEAGPEKKP